MLADDETTVGVVQVGEGGTRPPSDYTLFVYFVSEDAYVQSFGTRPYFSSTAEIFCVGDVCPGVTTALYVPTSIGADTLRQALVDNLNLGPLMNSE